MASFSALRELTELSREATGREVAIGADEETSPVDIPLYISDTRKVSQTFDWRPVRTPTAIVAELAEWVREHARELAPVLA